MTHVGDRFGQIVLRHEVDALLEDDLALVVHHVVVLQDLLADVEVARLDLLLSHLQALVHPAMRDRLAFLEAERAHHAVHALRTEDAHQVVVEREVELGAAGIALAARTAAQLVVDAAALVALGAEHVKSAGLQRDLLLRADLGGDFRLPLGDLGLARLAALRALVGHPVAHLILDVAAELDVGAAAGHVGGDGDGTRHAGLGDDVGFLLMVAGVEHLVRDDRHAGLRLSRDVLQVLADAEEVLLQLGIAFVLEVFGLSQNLVAEFTDVLLVGQQRR